MKIGLAQLHPIKGEIDANIAKHKTLIATAISMGADLLFFPELSITGYEPTLAKDLAIDQEDLRFETLQSTSDKHQITIGIGMPSKTPSGIYISMLVFQAGQARKTYSKQYLHADERPYFTQGRTQLILKIQDQHIAPAICYESLLPTHAEQALALGATIYLASVAKAAKGVAKAFDYYPSIAMKYAIPVLMSNAVGSCDNFICAGQSAIWNSDGILMGQLDAKKEGILLLDTNTQSVAEKIN